LQYATNSFATKLTAIKLESKKFATAKFKEKFTNNRAAEKHDL